MIYDENKDIFTHGGITCAGQHLERLSKDYKMIRSPRQTREKFLEDVMWEIVEEKEAKMMWFKAKRAAMVMDVNLK